MRNFIIASTLLVAGWASAGQTLKPTDNTKISFDMIEDFQSIAIGETEGEVDLTARLTMVFIGSAAGYDSVNLTLISGPTEVDYGNTHSYRLGNIVGTISNLRIEKTIYPKQYILSYNASTINITQNGDFVSADASRRLIIHLDKDNSLISVVDDTQ